MSVIEIDLRLEKLNLKLDHVKQKEEHVKMEIEENEYRLQKLKNCFSKSIEKFDDFEHVNRSLCNLSQLKFVKSWIARREENNLHERNKIMQDMDVSCDELHKQIITLQQDLENYNKEKFMLLKEIDELKKEKSMNEKIMF